MKFKWFQVKNYKSIEDSGKCYVSERITILAGKNESGKTNILTALLKFDLKQKFEEDDYNLYNTEKKDPEINLVFNISEKTWDRINEKLEYSYTPVEEISIIRKGNEAKYNFSFLNSNIHEVAGLILWKALNMIRNNIDVYNDLCEKNNLITLVDDVFLNISNEDIEEVKLNNFSKIQFDTQYLQNLKSKIRTHYNSLTQKLESSNNKFQLDSRIESIEKILDELMNHTNAADKLKNELIERVPNVVYFSSFEDILPFEVPVSDINRKIVQNFFLVVNLDPKILRSPSSQELLKAINSASTTIKGDFGSFWSQEELRIECQLLKNNLTFPIYDSDSNVPFKTEQRSKGLQWFISFYLTINATKEENTILLIDEPGLYLHAKAQQDLLKVLERLSKNHRIIFSTHMPYLIDINNLDRVRLVIKDEETKQTIIENKVHKNADFETLTPIITAIGLDITRCLELAKNQNLLVEGITDYYYLNHMKSLLNENSEECNENVYSIIPSMGADKISTLASLMIGWDLSFIVVLDSDKEGKRVAKNLKKKFFENIKILFISENDDLSIEDLYSKNDFRSILKEIENEIDFSSDSSNSRIIKEKKLNKYTIARKLIESKMKKTDFDEDTIEKFEIILNKISNIFKESRKIKKLTNEEIK